MDFQDLQHPIVAAIYKSYKEAEAKEPKRGYLGASIIGATCERYLWYIFRECAEEKFDGRMLRLFDHGDCEEARMIKDLRAIGCEVFPVQGTAGKSPGQQYEISAFGDHFSGHLDAIIRLSLFPSATWPHPKIILENYVGEFKTHNKKSFEKLKALKVQKAHPKHYAQMQVYMHKMSIKKALYLAVLKDTDELYAEVVEYNKDDAEALMLKAKRIITATEPPDRLYRDRGAFECRYCSAQHVCWGNPNFTKPEYALPCKSCRHCVHSRPDIEHSGAQWICGVELAIPDAHPCKHYTLIPGILPEEK